MSSSLFELLKYAKTRIHSHDMTQYDKMKALAMFGGIPIRTITGIPPISFKADGTPLISLSMIGNGQQTGTPSPDAPIMPEFMGVRTGNLFDMSDFSLLQVTSTAYRYGTSIGVLPQGSYTFSATKSAGAQSIYLTAKSNGTYSQTTISSVPFTFSADGESEYIICTANNTGTTWEAEKYSDIMLNTGSTALPYEPFGYKIPITCGGTTTPLYLGETPTVRKIGKIVFDGTEWWDIQVNRGDDDTIYVYGLMLDRKSIIDNNNYICSHFVYNARAFNLNSGQGFHVVVQYGNLRFRVNKSIATSIDTWKAYLAQQYANGTPVMVWYILAAEQTAIVDGPLAKIGEYADELHITDGVTIPTAKGSNTLTIGTTLQPSSVSITGHIMQV